MAKHEPCNYETKIAVMDTKLDAILGNVEEIKDDVKTQNNRVRKLENWRSMIVGGLILSAVIITALKVLL